MLYLFVAKLQNSIIVQVCAVIDLIIVYALTVVIRESTQMHTHMHVHVHMYCVKSTLYTCMNTAYCVPIMPSIGYQYTRLHTYIYRTTLSMCIYKAIWGSAMATLMVSIQVTHKHTVTRMLVNILH